MEIPKIRYIILTPVRNEINYFAKTLDSVVRQTICPIRWIIMDDDSTDGTSELIDKYAQKYSFIDHKLIKNFRTDLNSTGGRSGALLNLSRSFIKEDIDFVVKIDADISFGNNFFERIFLEFEKNLKLCIASGHLVQDGIPEKIKNMNTNRGATRIYRADCFNKIGSYYMMRGEDQMDTYKAQYLGYDTKTFDIYFDHLKPEGDRNSLVKNHYDTGKFKGQIPYNFIFFFLTLIKNILQKPYFLSSLIQLYGFLYAVFIKKEKPFDKDLCAFIRQKQKKSLLKFFH